MREAFLSGRDRSVQGKIDGSAKEEVAREGRRDSFDGEHEQIRECRRWGSE